MLEDNPQLGSLLNDYLGSIGYHVIYVKDGVDGLKAIMASECDLILCDMMIPNLSGEMFYRAVERINPPDLQAIHFHDRSQRRSQDRRLYSESAGPDPLEAIYNA